MATLIGHVNSLALNPIDFSVILYRASSTQGHAVAQLVEAFRYKSEGHGFDSRWCHWIFLLT